MNPNHQNVAEYLLDAKQPCRSALLTLQKSHSYGELEAASRDIAGYLLRYGGHKGDCALLVSDNSFFWVASYLGILRAGLVAVPLPLSISPLDYAFVKMTTNARFAFLQTGFAIRNGQKYSPQTVVTDKELSQNDGPESTLSLAQLQTDMSGRQVTLPEVDKSELAALMFTSGSTGKPRGVMVSHANIMANTDSIIQYLGLTDKDRIMTVLPFYYCFGTSLLHTHLRVGGVLVLDHRFMYPETVLQRMRETECTGFAGVPSHYQILVRRTSLRKRPFPHLRYVQQAGGSLAPVFLRELRESLPGTQIFVMYGQTEATARISYLPPECLEVKMGSVGNSIPGVKISVLREDGHKVGLEETGEIVVEGDNVTQGYWQDPEGTARTFRKGKLYTGDQATMDSDGYLYIVGRKGDFIKCCGKRISCKQLEQQILEFEELVEVAVIGTPDEIKGEAVKAFVVPRRVSDGVEQRVRKFCKERFPFELVPREIVVLNTLPKNHIGKVTKEHLRTLTGAVSQQQVLV